jgi:hypothetical protein
MDDHIETAERYRERAKEVRRLAESFELAETRHGLFGVARGYGSMADLFERIAETERAIADASRAIAASGPKGDEV